MEHATELATLTQILGLLARGGCKELLPHEEFLRARHLVLVAWMDATPNSYRDETGELLAQHPGVVSELLAASTATYVAACERALDVLARLKSSRPLSASERGAALQGLQSLDRIEARLREAIAKRSTRPDAGS